MWRWVLLASLAGTSAHAVETMRISMGAPRTQVVVRGEALAYGPDSVDGPFRALGSDAARVDVSHGHLELNGARVVGVAIRFRSHGAEPMVGVSSASEPPAGVVAESAAGPAGDPDAWGRRPIRVGKEAVRGDVVARLHHGKLELINVLPLEVYLAAVLGGEMPASFPAEALKAQAVAARTYAVHRKLSALGEPYYLGSGVLSQVYGGMAREDPRTAAAVKATRGEILTWHMRPIEAYFSSSCGGRTESGEAALGRDLPYLKSVSCPCGKLRRTHWTVTLTPRMLERAFGDEADSLEVVARTKTGRARLLRVGRRTVDGATFRRKLGYEVVKSLAFEVKRTSEGFLLTGRGFGHGAGMCQWGAKLYAQQGWSYRKILAHYYPGTTLQRMY